MGGVVKRQLTQLGCERYLLQGHILSTARDALVSTNKSGGHKKPTIWFIKYSFIPEWADP